MLFKKDQKNRKEVIESKFKVKDFVDFFYKDDVYFGVISDIYLDSIGNINYDIDIAGQCPTTITQIEEKKVIRIHSDL